MAADTDPFEIQPIERAVNNSAVRLSAIWITYLVFGLYLAVAVGNITPRQLFVAKSFKLPVLNIELPLLGFFFLAPILFVIIHAYVLLQLVLLSHTAATYNEAVDYQFKTQVDRRRIRQRLANTLFAQLFAGSPREREGLLGALLRAIAWLLLVFFPLILLFGFELKFLPFHSHVVTWCHRCLIAADLVLLLLLWKGALNPQIDVSWHNLTSSRRDSVAAALTVLVCFLLPTFPREFDANWTRFHTTASQRTQNRGFGYGFNRHATYCDLRSILSVIWSPTFDRFNLTSEVLVDRDRLEKTRVQWREISVCE